MTWTGRHAVSLEATDGTRVRFPPWSFEEESKFEPLADNFDLALCSGIRLFILKYTNPLHTVTPPVPPHVTQMGDAAWFTALYEYNGSGADPDTNEYQEKVPALKRRWEYADLVWRLWRGDMVPENGRRIRKGLNPYGPLPRKIRGVIPKGKSKGGVDYLWP